MKIASAPFIQTSFTAPSSKKAESSEPVSFEDVKASSKPTSIESTKAADTRANADIPVEAYAIPKWMTGFYRDITNEMALGTSATYVDPKNIGWASATQEELAEFNELRQKHLVDLYESNGLSDLITRYKAVNSVPGLNERLKDQFYASVSADPKLMSLMNKIGINPS